MPYRRFDGVEDYLVLPHAYVNPSAAVSIALLVRPTALADAALLESDSGFTIRMVRTGIAVVTGPSTAMVSRSVVFAAGAWRLFVLTKVANNVTARMHVYDFATRTWSRHDGAVYQAPLYYQLSLGTGLSSGMTFAGDVAGVGIWQVQLTDLQVNQLVTVGAQSLWPTITAGMRALWTLEQRDVVNDVAVDRISAAQQVEVWGTTAVSEAPPITYEPGCVAYPIGRTWDDGPLNRWDGSSWVRMRGLVSF